MNCDAGHSGQLYHYSAGKRDRGKKKKKKKNKAPLARAKEGPKAPTQARSTEEEAEGLRRLGRKQAPPKKSFRLKLKNLPALYIHDCVKLKTRLSRKRPSRLIRNLKLCSFCL